MFKQKKRKTKKLSWVVKNKNDKKLINALDVGGVVIFASTLFGLFLVLFAFSMPDSYGGMLGFTDYPKWKEFIALTIFLSAGVVCLSVIVTPYHKPSKKTRLSKKGTFFLAVLLVLAGVCVLTIDKIQMITLSILSILLYFFWLYLERDKMTFGGICTATSVFFGFFIAIALGVYTHYNFIDKHHIYFNSLDVPVNKVSTYNDMVKIVIDINSSILDNIDKSRLSINNDNQTFILLPRSDLKMILPLNDNISKSK